MTGRLRSITIYETPSRFYLVGRDMHGIRHNVLKIDRVDSKALVTGEPETDYTHAEIQELLATISEGSSVVVKSDARNKNTRGALIERVTNAFGLLGVVRFLEGYYLIVITKASAVAQFGFHSLYKVEEVAMISIAMDGLSTSSEEQRYVKLFQSVDLSTDFYFSYTYDLSRSLQENVLSTNWENGGERKIQSDRKFVWNNFLLAPLRNNIVSERWFTEVVHGYIGQQLITLPCARLSLTLIGRRSAEYSGTRFLKRGANFDGAVANDVETEQIIWDRDSAKCFLTGRFSSFVQRRGSVPLRWSQDPATRGVVGKPLILVDIHEPHAQTAGAHFRDLRRKYGSPLIVMNLVKRREKRRHESLLHEQFLKAVSYLNQFLPDSEKICYLSFDVARCNKASTITNNVLTKLDEIALKAVLKNGWFQTFQPLHTHDVCKRSVMCDYTPMYSSDGHFIIQHGISRTNCVDCLDRTNVAQFGIGKVALACQLFSLGVLDEPYITLQSEVCRTFEEMFDTHGDTMAWQYAGSQLVHSIKTYKKTAAFQERSRDVIQTLSRYYSNTFGDYDKQAAINLFLGMFRPQISSMKHLWELPTDYYLHFPNSTRVTTDYCAWMIEPSPEAHMNDSGEDDEVLEPPLTASPAFSNGSGKPPPRDMNRIRSKSREEFGSLLLNNESDYRDYYRTFDLLKLEQRVRVEVINDSNAITVGAVNEEATNSGQFMKLWKTDEKKDTKSSKTADKESDDDDDDLEEVHHNEDVAEYEDTWYRLVGRERRATKEKESSAERHEAASISSHHHDLKKSPLATGLLFSRERYGIASLSTKREDRDFYEQYTSIGGPHFNKRDWEEHKPKYIMNVDEEQTRSRRSTLFTADNTLHTEVPEVSRTSMKFYAKSCDLEAFAPSKVDMATFSKYLNIY